MVEITTSMWFSSGQTIAVELKPLFRRPIGFAETLDTSCFIGECSFRGLLPGRRLEDPRDANDAKGLEP